jgi:hypothetical protein
VINFRYHVVSLTAVFLALAIGLVVGTAALNGPVADSLKNQVTSLSKDNSNYRDQANQYRDELNNQQEFATEVSGPLIGGKLAGRKVLVVALPGAEDYLKSVVAMLTLAGAKVTAQVTVQDKFLDPANEVELLDLSDQSSQPTVPVDGLPSNSNGVQTASALLFRALQARVPEVTAADLSAVLTAFTKQGDISVADGAVSGAEATVILSGLPPVDSDAAKKNEAAVNFAVQFDDKPLVVAGSDTGNGNLIAEIRGDPSLVQKISTVDDVTTIQGQLATAMTLIERMVDGKVGQYGTSTGATSQVPKAGS